MKASELGKKLDKEFGSVYRTVLVSGKWGIGKSYYLNQYTKTKTVYYISLFGMDNITSFKEELRYKVCGHKSFYEKIKGGGISTPVVGFTLPDFEEDLEKTITKKFNKKDKVILIVDDFERKNSNFEMSTILGLLTRLSIKIKQLSIILVCDENGIDEFDRKIFNNFKEKIIDKTYNITEYDMSAVVSICKDIKYDLSEIVRKTFTETYSDIKNLRTLIKAIAFLNIIIPFIKIEKLSKDEKIELVECTLAVIIAINEQEYKNLNTPSLIRNHFYGKGDEFEEKEKLINILYKLYVNDDSAYEVLLNNYYEQRRKLLETAKKAVKDDKKEEIVYKDLFYCSKDELLVRADAFRNNSILKVDKNYDIYSFRGELDKFDHYLSMSGVHNFFDKKEIMKAIDNYVDLIDFGFNVDSFYENYNSNFINEYQKIIDNKIALKIIDLYYDKIKDNLKNNVYDSKVISAFFSFLRTRSNEIDLTNEINKLKDNEFFIPDLNDSLDESGWKYTHRVCNELFNVSYSTELDNNIRTMLYDVLNKRLENASSLGKYRIGCLIDQYNMESRVNK